jgi:putative colanic acid biosynthesis glycosyltransferase
MFTQHQSMFYRRASVRDLAYDLGLGVAADYAFTMRLLLRGGRAHRLRWPVAACAPPGLSGREARRGRREQALVRARILRLPGIACLAIEHLQAVTWWVRAHVPTAFDRLRCTSFGRRAEAAGRAHRKG